MSKPTSFVPDHRLRSLLLGGGGVSVSEAVSRANRRLEAVRDQCVSALDGKIDELAALSPTSETKGLYALATEIYSLAGTFGLMELAEAANSMCDLLVGAESRGDALSSDRSTKYAESVRVHIDALRTLRRPELSADVAGRKAVVHGLRLVASQGR